MTDQYTLRIQKVRREYLQQLSASEFDNLDEVDTSLKGKPSSHGREAENPDISLSPKETRNTVKETSSWHH